MAKDEVTFPINQQLMIHKEMTEMTILGFIGTGHMGSMLVRKFIETRAASPEKILISNRTREDAERLAADLGVVCKSNRDVAKLADIILLCVRPLDVKSALAELQDLLTPEKLLVSVAGDVSLKSLRSMCSARVARAFPSIACESQRGVTLLAMGEGVTDSDRAAIYSLFGSIGRALEASEDHFEVMADLTSCGPGYLAAIFREFAVAASLQGVPREVAEGLIVETLAGTARILESRSFEDLIACVATRGGITEEGVSIIRADAPRMFSRLFAASREKHSAIKSLIADQSK